jgi:hypothetical protein
VSSSRDCESERASSLRSLATSRPPR